MKLWRDQSWKKRTAVVAAGSALAMMAGVGVGYAVTDVPQPNAFATKQALQLLYSDGKPMARFGTNRVLVPLEKVSKAAQQAVLAAEDRDFYSEPGISPKGIARALFSNVKGGGVQQGGSTITQQYAKNAFLTQERTYSRKIKEVFIALKMTRTVSKDQILEDYLNTIYFGRGAFGIEAASNTYFGRHASALTLAQGAVLASTIRSPAGYDPERHLERAKGRWGYVLDGMLEKGWISQEQRAGAVYPKVDKRKAEGSLPGDLDHVRDQVVAELEKHGFAEDSIAAGGLVVVTTIDRKAQDAARAAVDGELPASKKADRPVGALVAVQPGTGRVVAYYGGRTAGGIDFAGGDTGLEPGSSMKPYVLAAALEDGKKLRDRYDGRSPQDVCGDTVNNDAGDPPFGRIDLVTGMAHSVNTVYTRLACDVGPKKVVDLAHKAGITTKLDGEGNVSQQVALGSGGYQVTPLDQAVGYATFAAKGVHASPFFVLRVKDRHNNVIYRAKPDTSPAFSEEIAADVTYAMQKVVSEGTGKRAKVPGRPTAGKTGTTTGNKNAWFCGLTPQLAAVAWVGRPSGKPLKGLPGYPNGVYGGTIPAKIFRAFMTAALEGEPVMQFPEPSKDAVAATPTPTPTPTSTPSPTSAPTAPVSLPPVVPTNPGNGPPSASPTPSPTASPAASP